MADILNPDIANVIPLIIVHNEMIIAIILNSTKHKHIVTGTTVEWRIMESHNYTSHGSYCSNA